jgi:hypothetical protein
MSFKDLLTLCYLSQSKLFTGWLEFGIDLHLLPHLPLLYVVNGRSLLLEKHKLI